MEILAVGLRTTLYATLWRAILNNPDFRFRAESEMRLWIQNSLRPADTALAFWEAQPQVSRYPFGRPREADFLLQSAQLVPRVRREISDRHGLAGHLLGSQAGSVSPDEIPFAYQNLPPFLSQSFFVNAFARYLVLIAADAGVGGQLTSSARLDFNGGADALVF